MKIYDPKTPKIVRLTITKNGLTPKEINFVETELGECVDEVVKVLHAHRDEHNLRTNGTPSTLLFTDMVIGSQTEVLFNGLSPFGVWDVLTDEFEIQK